MLQLLTYLRATKREKKKKEIPTSLLHVHGKEAIQFVLQARGVQIDGGKGLK